MFSEQVMDNFGECAIDRARRLVMRNGKPVHLTPKAYELLDVLLEASPQVVAKADLMSRLWPRTFVVEANLSNLVAEIRAALGDSSRESRWIRTAYNFGYGFVAQPRPEVATADVPSPVVACWLVHERREFALPDGDHLIGRHSDSVVPLYSTTISRRHALIMVNGGLAVLCDLGRQNGTFVGDVPVEGSRILSDRDTIKVGDSVLQFRVADLRHPTEELLPAMLPLPPRSPSSPSRG